MSEIDWDKAPEWADRVVRIGISKNIAWACDDKYKYLSGDGPFIFNEDPTDGFMLCQTTLIEQRPSPTWSGEGLPPVGHSCEVNDLRTDRWQAVDEVIAHASLSDWDVAVFRIGDYIAYAPADHFRPARTPEQIAKDERDHKIRNACTTISLDLRALHESEEPTALAIIEAMIDAGYEKQADQ